MTRPRGSIVIPAHNEAESIGRCLSALGTALDDYEVVVVSNGSTDATADCARAELGGRAAAQVIETATASKAHALRLGDEAAQAYPRMFLDADIAVDAETVDHLMGALTAASTPRVGAPRLVMSTTGSSWLVRSYHRVWARLPYARDGVIGTGIYAVNEAGADRLGAFPDTLNDDEWVRRHFSPDETLHTQGTFAAAAPRTFRALVRQKARTELGNQTLADQAQGPTARSTGMSDLVSHARSSPGAAVDTMSYLTVVVGARVLARWRHRTGRSSTWATDTTSRQAATPSPLRVPQTEPHR